MADRRKGLIDLRTSRGWTQRQVAERLGVTDAYYGMIESGVRTPRLILGLRIADIFGVRPDEIFFGSKSNGTSDKPTGTDGTE